MSLGQGEIGAPEHFIHWSLVRPMQLFGNKMNRRLQVNASIFIYMCTNILNVYNICIYVWIHLKHIKAFLRRFPLGKPSRNSGISTSVAADSTRTPHSDSSCQDQNMQPSNTGIFCLFPWRQMLVYQNRSSNILQVTPFSWIVCHLNIFKSHCHHSYVHKYLHKYL